MLSLLALIALTTLHPLAHGQSSVGCGRQAEPYAPTLGGGPSKLRVINGAQTKPHSWPWAISFQNFMPSHFCGGSLLRVKDGVEQSDIVLTAAHCIPQFKTNGKPIAMFLKPYSILVGAHAQSDGEKNRVGLIDVRVHQNYSKVNKLNDIAIVKLDRPVAFDKTVRPVCLPQPAEDVPVGKTCVAVGWGRNDAEDDTKLSDTLQQLVVPVHDQNKCFQKWVRVFSKELMTCAGSMDGTSTVCNGDSGGPLVCQAPDGSWVQHGVANFVGGISCMGKQPPVYARVATFTNWIRQQIEELTSLK